MYHALRALLCVSCLCPIFLSVPRLKEASHFNSRTMQLKTSFDIIGQIESACIIESVYILKEKQNILHVHFIPLHGFAQVLNLFLKL